MPAPASERPLSPHLQIWRWHVTMFTSIMNRASGVALFVGALGFVAWLYALAFAPELFVQISEFLFSPIGQLGLIGIVIASFFHLAAGIRHLAWDSGRGFLPKTADGTAWVAIVFALVSPIVVWAVAGF